MKKMTDSAKSLVLLRKHSILNVYERDSIYLDHKKFYGRGGGFRLMCHPVMDFNTRLPLYFKNTMYVSQAWILPKYFDRVRESFAANFVTAV